MEEVINYFGKYSAQIIALCALAFTTYHAYQQRKHNKLSVKPHLTNFVQSDSDENKGHIKMELQNNGLGPAFIKKFQIYLDNEPCSYSHALDVVTENLPCKLNFTNLEKGYAIPAGDIKCIVSVKFTNSISISFEEICKKFNRIDILVDYECAYGSAYNFNTFDNETTKTS